MTRRVKTDLNHAIIKDRESRELWLYAYGNMPLYPDAPEGIAEREREYRIRSLDILFNDGIADAIHDGWVPLPPIMSRHREEKDWLRPGSGIEIHERRVRVILPEMLPGGYGTPVHTARVVWIVEPRISHDGWGEEWAVYTPTYDDGNP